MRDLVIDFETYYSRSDAYDLGSISMTEYVRDSRFQVHGLAYRFIDEKKSHWISGNHVLVAWIRSIDWQNIRIIAHNCKFDGSILAWHYKVKPHSWFDTVGLAKAVLGNNVSGYHLKGLAEYLGLRAKGELKWDGVRDLTAEQEAEMAEYCKGDVDICAGIYEKLAPQFPAGQHAAMDWTIRAFIEPRLVLDKACLSKGVQDEKERREKAIQESGIDKKVLASNKQFAEYLASKAIPVPTKLSSRTGKPIPAFARTDDGLSQLAGSNPILHAARIASKANLLETRGQSLLAVAQAGPFPFDVGFSGATQTHRYSGGSGAGGNPQNFTRKSFLREAVCAPPGYSLVVGDFAAVELRIVSWLSKEAKLINKLVNDEDVYADFASTLYNKPISKKDPERAFGKEAILGLGYSMGADKFQLRIKTVLKQEISHDEAWNTVDLYRSTYARVPDLWEKCSSMIPLIATGQVGCLYFAPFLKVRKGSIILPSGLALQYPNLRSIVTQGPRGPRTEWIYDVYKKKYEAEPVRFYGGKMVENICQALAGELCKEAILRAEDRGLVVVGQVHDEILCLVRQDAAEGQAERAACQVLRECMEQSPRWMPELKLKAEVGWGANWNEAKN